MAEKLRLAIIGLGRIGKKHAENLVYKIPNCDVRVICTPVEEEQKYARETLGITDVASDYADVLARDDIDAVFIVTPTILHADQIIQGLEAGKHVFCEKPVALNVEDCVRVEKVSSQYPGLVCCIGFVRRWDPSLVEAKRQIDAGEVGVPFLVRSQTADMDEWAAFQVAGVPASGGIFPDMSIHDIDLVHWLTGQTIDEVYALGGAYAHPEFLSVNDADNVSAMCRLSGGGMANISGSRTAHHGHDTYAEIHGTQRTLIIGSNPSQDRLVIKDKHGVRNTCVPDFFARFADAFLLEATDFVNCCLNGIKPRVSLEDARKATQVAIALRESFQSGSVVKIDSQLEIE
jgi:myo-inositol 2-dehydrogenase/D-chiro-inositol 1-dehydrogenase